MSDEKTRLTLTQYVAASRDRVFRAWTDPAWMCRWFAPGDMTVPIAEADPRVGGSYRVQMNGCMESGEIRTHTTTGVYREVIPNEKLVFTWGWEGPERHESLVTVLFADKGSGTEVTLLHERLESAESVDKHAHGWQGCLANLAGRIGQLR